MGRRKLILHHYENFLNFWTPGKLSAVTSVDCSKIIGIRIIDCLVNFIIINNNGFE